MKKNNNARPADISNFSSNISFNEKDKKNFRKILYIILILFSFAIADIFNINFYLLFDIYN